MLECPYCGEPLDQKIFNNWFQCRNCKNWFRLRRGQNGPSWLQRGRIENDEVQPVRAAGQPLRAPAQGQNAPPRRSLPNVNDMDLPAVRTERPQVTARLRRLESEIQRVIGLLTQNRQSDPLVRQYTGELSQLTLEQNELNKREQRLIERENFLEEEAARAAQQNRRSPAGFIYVSGSLLAGAGIYLFTRMINLHLDPRAYLVLIAIALGSGLLTLLIAQLK